jgi:hypothetical protein
MERYILPATFMAFSNVLVLILLTLWLPSEVKRFLSKLGGLLDLTAGAIFFWLNMGTSTVAMLSASLTAAFISVFLFWARGRWAVA